MAPNSVARYEIGVSYIKCLRNHAKNQWLYCCGEFAPDGKEGTPNFPFCPACGCNRSFHERIEVLVPLPLRNHDDYQLIDHYTPVMANPAPSHTILQPADVSAQGERPMDKGAEKKIRTKINPKQKEVLKAFADGVGWTPRNRNEGGIMRVCIGLGITRSILMNWINNNRKKVMPVQQSMAAQHPDVIILQRK